MDKILAKSYREPRFVAITKAGDTKKFRTYFSAARWITSQEPTPFGCKVEWSPHIGVGISVVRAIR